MTDLRVIANARHTDPMNTWPEHIGNHKRTLMGEPLTDDGQCLRCALELAAIRAIKTVDKPTLESGFRTPEAPADIPHMPAKDVNGKACVYIPFSDYELGNLLSMFTALFPDQVAFKVENLVQHPFSVFHTGDWVSVAGRFKIAVATYAPNAKGNMDPAGYRRLALEICKRINDESTKSP